MVQKEDALKLQSGVGDSYSPQAINRTVELDQSSITPTPQKKQKITQKTPEE